MIIISCTNSEDVFGQSANLLPLEKLTYYLQNKSDLFCRIWDPLWDLVKQSKP